MNTNNSGPTIQVHGLRKSYGRQVVLDGIDFEVAQGTVYSLLGPNGSGKTTTIQILSTLISADDGDVRVAGHDLSREPDAVRAAIGVTGQFSAVDKFLTGEENLVLMADLRHMGKRDGRRRAAELLDRFDLAEAANKPVSTYSGGMQRRLDLAMTLVGDPRIIFLDEPTAGLDPRSRRTMWQIVRGLVASGVTIFLTTQYLEEADQLADRIAVLYHGKLVAQGTAAELLLTPTSRDDEALTLQVSAGGDVRSLKSMLDRLDGAGIEVDGLTVHTPDLDDVFLALTGHPDTTEQQEAIAR